jgi:hypothetical protein
MIIDRNIKHHEKCLKIIDHIAFCKQQQLSFALSMKNELIRKHSKERYETYKLMEKRLKSYYFNTVNQFQKSI